MAIAGKNFRDEELMDTKTVLEENDFKVHVAAPTKDLAVGKLGMKIIPDIDFPDIEEGRYEGIIFIGGPGAFDLIENKFLHEIARKFYEKNKLVAAICIASAILAEAGLLSGKRATVHFSGAEYLEKAGALYKENDLEIDGNIITASGPVVAARFGQEIVNYLKQKNSGPSISLPV